MSPEQQNLWTHYHDILFFDTTARTNKYNMMACFFVIIDNCNRTRLVATALLENETESSFVWALQMIKKCMENLMPK
ncbi:16523_t:CDS:1, partial [Dentiscutata heterogama]